MAAKERVPAIDGWFRVDGEPRLLGTRCTKCGSYFFPRQSGECRNPGCDGTDLAEVPLSNRGTVWSYTTNHYAPPSPFVASEPFAPYSVAAVELAEEKLVVLGQVDAGTDPADLRVGAEVELAVGTLYEDDDHEYVVWKWKMTGGPEASARGAGLPPRSEPGPERPGAEGSESGRDSNG